MHRRAHGVHDLFHVSGWQQDKLSVTYRRDALLERCPAPPAIVSNIYRLETNVQTILLLAMIVTLKLPGSNQISPVRRLRVPRGDLSKQRPGGGTRGSLCLRSWFAMPNARRTGPEVHSSRSPFPEPCSLDWYLSAAYHSTMI